MEKIILTGPSSAGKTTFSKTFSDTHAIIDSDDVWFELANETNWNHQLINDLLVERTLQHAKKHKRVIFVTTNENPLKERVKGHQVWLVGTNLKNIRRNIEKRGDRTIGGVLDNIYCFFRPSRDRENTIFIRESDLDAFHCKTKRDRESVERFRKRFFGDGFKTTRMKPAIPFDRLIVT